jgi:hypothetical protein
MGQKTARAAVSEFISMCRARAGDLATLELADESASRARTVVVAVYDKVGVEYIETIRPLDRPFDGLIDGAELIGRTGSAVVFIEVPAVSDADAPAPRLACKVVLCERRGEVADLFYGTDGGETVRCEIADLPTPASRRYAALVVRRAGAVVTEPPVLLAGEVLGALWCFSTLSFVHVFGTPLGVQTVLASDPLKFINPQEPSAAWDAVGRYVTSSVAPLHINGVDIRPSVPWLGAGGLGWVLLGQAPRVDDLRAMITEALDSEAATCLISGLRSRGWWPRR